jgi:hypothetical protein
MLIKAFMPANPSYEPYQDHRDREYREAWKKAPRRFIKAASKIGIEGPDLDRSGEAIEYDTNAAGVAYTVDMAAGIDTIVDDLVERYGAEHRAIIIAVIEEMKKPMIQEIEKNQAVLLNRVAGFMIASERSNILARVHSLIHAIPLLAEVNGITSMRHSARLCGVSPEWIKRGRDQACEALGLKIPEARGKSALAKVRYALNGKNHHWRTQLFIATPQQKPKTTPCT